MCPAWTCIPLGFIAPHGRMVSASRVGHCTERAKQHTFCANPSDPAGIWPAISLPGTGMFGYGAQTSRGRYRPSPPYGTHVLMKPREGRALMQTNVGWHRFWPDRHPRKGPGFSIRVIAIYISTCPRRRPAGRQVFVSRGHRGQVPCRSRRDGTVHPNPENENASPDTHPAMQIHIRRQYRQNLTFTPAVTVRPMRVSNSVSWRLLSMYRRFCSSVRFWASRISLISGVTL